MFTNLLQKIGGVNWTTNIPGVLSAACASSELLGLLPQDYSMKAMQACLILTSLGVIAAKSSNVTNAQNPGAAKPVN